MDRSRIIWEIILIDFTNGLLPFLSDEWSFWLLSEDPPALFSCVSTVNAFPKLLPKSSLLENRQDETLWSELTAIWEVEEEGSYGRRQTGNGPAHLGSESGLGLLSQSESMSSPSPSLSLPIADRLRPDRARVCSPTHTPRRTRSGALRGKKREIHRKHAEQMQRRKERRRIKVKTHTHNCDRSYCTTPVLLVSVAGFFFSHSIR